MTQTLVMATLTLFMATLTVAYWKKKPKPSSLHHSDCGGQYCSVAYRALQASDAMQTSMSRKGNGWNRCSQASARSAKLA